LVPRLAEEFGMADGDAEERRQTEETNPCHNF
jgi:hypothetical protein